MAEDFIVSADGHFVEPTDLFVTRLPKHLRELAVWEEDFEVEPLGGDGVPLLPEAAHAGLRGLDLHAVPPPRRVAADR